jgi:hypothetical protein
MLRKIQPLPDKTPLFLLPLHQLAYNSAPIQSMSSLPDQQYSVERLVAWLVKLGTGGCV